MANTRKVSPEDFDVKLEQLKKAALEGRLIEIIPKETELSEEVLDRIRSHVDRIRSYVTSKYSQSVDEIWNDIFQCQELRNLLKPSGKARDCEEFNKYKLMGIICVLRSNGVYEEYSDPTFDAKLEPTKNGNSSYRRFLSQGIDNDKRVIVRQIVEKYKH